MPLTLPTSGAAIDTVTWDTIATASLFNVAQKLYDQFLTSNPLLAMCNARARVTLDGGEWIKRDVRYGASSNIVAFSGDQPIEAGGFDDRLPTRWNWKNLAGPIMVTDEDLIITKTSDIGASLNLLTESVDYVMRGFNEYMDQILFEDGTAQGGKVPLGLQALVSTTPTTGVLAGLDRATYSWWRNSARTSCGSFALNGINGTSTNYFLSMYNDLTDGMYKPNVIVCDPDILEWYELNLPEPTIMLSKESVDLGFGTLQYKGMPMYGCRKCPSGYAYMMDFNAFEFVVSREWNFTNTGFLDMRASGRFAKVCYIVLRSNFINMRPMASAVLSGWTA